MKGAEVVGRILREEGKREGEGEWMRKVKEERKKMEERGN